MAPPLDSLRQQVEDFLKQQLAAYKRQLPTNRSGTGRLLAEATIGARERGAEDFTLFLLGQKRPNERIRGRVR